MANFVNVINAIIIIIIIIPVINITSYVLSCYLLVYTDNNITNNLS